MAVEIGLSPGTFYEEISNSSGAFKVLDTKFAKMKNRQYDSGFQTKLLVKDMNIALNQSQHQDLQLLKKALEIYAQGTETMEGRIFPLLTSCFANMNPFSATDRYRI